MKLLALDGGSEILSAALYEDGLLRASEQERAPRRQTELLASLVQSLLGIEGWKTRELDALACAVGPGSFSGLRSSLAFGTGLKLAHPGLCLIGVGSLEAWATAFAPETVRKVRVLLDGRRGQAYGTLLERRAEGGWKSLEEPCLMDLAQWRERQGPELVLSDLDSSERPPDSGLAEAVGRLALGILRRGEAGFPWEPRYLRRPEAVILWDKLHPPGEAEPR